VTQRFFVEAKPYRLRGTPPVAVANGAGVATITFGPPRGEWWELTDLQIFTNSALLSSAVVYIGDDVEAANFHSTTPVANNDIWTGDPITVLDQETLTIVWAGLTPGAQCWARTIVTALRNTTEAY
jgi:hypothetical protein